MKLIALIKKEILQIIRDPSTILIVVLMPLVLLFVFGYGINLDTNQVKIGMVLEDRTPSTVSLVKAFSNSKFLNINISINHNRFKDDIVSGKLRGFVVIPQDFTSKAALKFQSANMQVIADGSEPSIASSVQNYSAGALNAWLGYQNEDRAIKSSKASIDVESRYWYNQELKSRNYVIPGSIAIIVMLIGTLLTTLVIAREWERGTMEAIMATPVSIREILLSKLIPYFVLGIASMILCWIVAVFWYEVPFRGSFLALLALTSFFLIPALGQGLLISSVSKDQFLASEIALMSAFLPAFMLSGFIYEISAMPEPIQWITYTLAARYFVTSLQTVFLTGDVWSLLLSCIIAMTIIGAIFFILTARKTVKRLDA